MAKMKANERLEAKKDRQNAMIAGAAAVLVLILVVAGILFLFNGGLGGGAPTTFEEPQVDATGQNLLLPLSNLTGNSFRFFSYDVGGTAVKYFILKDQNGDVHTAFDACDVCYRSKRGYHQSGDNAQCNNCGKPFSIYDIGTKNIGGSCWPGYLPHEVQGDNVVIKISDLEAGKYYFS